MIFSVSNHIQLITSGKKTQTRRNSDRYREYTPYAVQPKRGAAGIPEGKIVICLKKREWKPSFEGIPEDAHFARAMIRGEAGFPISDWEAKAEGNYTPESYEKLYEELCPGWVERWAYYFLFYTKQEVEEMVE